MVRMAVWALTHTELLSSAKELRGRQVWFVHRKVTPSHVSLSEDVLQDHTHSIFLSEGIFRQQSQICQGLFLLKHMLKECTGADAEQGW